MEIQELIQHPELMDKETLYDLRSLLAIHPYYQTARLLMLQNLYLLHDATFDEELRSAALYVTDRRKIFDMIEATHYKIHPQRSALTAKSRQEEQPSEDRTAALINNFLDSIPSEKESEVDKKTKRKPTPADAAVDYVAYLLETETEEEHLAESEDRPQLRGQSLIDNFIYNEKGKIQLKDEPEFVPEIEEPAEGESAPTDEGYFTETLAKIYIKQGRYEKALEIIKRLDLNYPKKNAYFADQIRFLEKLIINNKNKITTK
uniref:Tetratricopeptide repeat protein n=1 Tax=Prevotella sp. GTC17259 TaxID=3236795 RepID=A0AB33IZI1_9BACT